MRKAEAISRNGNTITIRGPEGKSHSKGEFRKVCQAVGDQEVISVRDKKERYLDAFEKGFPSLLINYI